MGGHGGLNILPQKSWHVYNYDNREKVKADEEKEAARVEQERLEQQHRDAEIRRNLLLDRAKSRRASGAIEGQTETRVKAVGASPSIPVQDEKNMESEKKIVATASSDPPAHINLFQDMVSVGDASRGVAHKSKRPARPEEAKVEDVKYSLGYGAISDKGEKPWYLAKQTLADRKEDDGHSRKRSKEEQPRLPKKQRKSLEELRNERVKREQQERDRARKVLIGHAAFSVVTEGRKVGFGNTGTWGVDESMVKGSDVKPRRYNSGFGHGR